MIIVAWIRVLVVEKGRSGMVFRKLAFLLTGYRKVRKREMLRVTTMLSITGMRNQVDENILNE